MSLVSKLNQNGNQQQFRAVLVVEDTKGKRIIELDKNIYSIGRESKSSIVLHSRLVSRHHATLLRVSDTENDSYFFQIIDGDLQGNHSTNGLIINGRHCAVQTLRNNDLIMFGGNAKARYFIVNHNLSETEILAYGETGNLLSGNSSFDPTETIVPDEIENNLLSEAALLRLASFPELLPSPIIEIDLNGKITYVNPSALVNFPDIQKANLNHSILAGLLDTVKNGTKDFIVREVQVGDAIFEQTVHYIAESRLIRSYLVDITERKQQELELRASESRLAQFLEAVPVGVFVIDASGQPYYANQKAQQLLGKTVAPLATSDRAAEFYQFYIAGTDIEYPIEDLPSVRALKGESATANDIEVHQKDKVIPIEAWGTPIFDEQSKVTYAIVAFQDIRERKLAEAERVRSTIQLSQLNVAYQRFVPREFLQVLDKQSIVDVQLGDQVQREMSVLFADIRNFTTLSESLTPEDNFKFINAYLSRMEPAIIKNHGFIDKYIGDAIMALFSGNADDAVKAGNAMLRTLTEYNQHRQRVGYVPLQIGIGINTGSLMLGTVGGHNRMDGTVISDAVNLASRIEKLTKKYEVSLLISHHTFSHLQNPDQYAIRMIDKVKVKGKSETVIVYEVFDEDLPEIKEAKLATAEMFKQALTLYNTQSFIKAEKVFQNCLLQSPRDQVAQIYLERCQQHFQASPC
ncbi:MAG TPA: adenylate/guanylate cyclase domain-containing protein [Candidatus Obscuribacterales bacterium]